MTRHARLALGIVALLGAARSVGAQDMRAQVRNLYRFGTCETLICLSTLIGEHGTHFNQSAGEVAVTITDFLGAAISTGVGNTPLGSTSSGITFSFDPTGAPVATSQSTGPIFGERSQTLGRGRLLTGVNATGNSYESIRGIKISDLRVTLTHQDVSPSGLGTPDFEHDTIQIRTNMNTSVTVFTAYMSYGLTNQIDLGLAVPVVRLSMSGTSIGTISNTALVNNKVFNYHVWRRTNGTVDTARASGSATGVGDVAVRAKFNLLQTPRGGAAFLADVRLPTGNKDNLLGSGNTSVRGLLIASARFAQFTPHVNAGYLYRTGSNENSAMIGTIGFDALVAPALTIAAEVLGQFEVGASNIALPSPAHYSDGGVVRRTNIPDQKDNIFGASFGAKFLVGRVLDVVGNLIVPLSDGGMRSKAIWTIGFERNF